LNERYAASGKFEGFTMNAIIPDLQFEYRRHKALADKAIAQLDDKTFFQRPTALNNSVAHIVKHVAGNLRSRFTDFFTTDGDKGSRNRDGEFVITEQDTRAALHEAWEAGWKALFDTFAAMQPADLAKTITVRDEPHTILQALLRSVTHTAYHVGQILYLVRLLQPESQWLTIAPGQSELHKKGAYFKSR
jgi:uncharacterized damage-inducible protein DinB